jgi:hypothetical protein
MVLVVVQEVLIQSLGDTTQFVTQETLLRPWYKNIEKEMECNAAPFQSVLELSETAEISFLQNSSVHHA